MDLLVATGLTKNFQSTIAVNNIDLTIKQGSLVALLGPNGAGKSTTISMLIGSLTPTAGTVTLNGAQHRTSGFDHQIGIVFQNSVLDKELTVAQNLQTRAKMYTHVAPGRVDKLMEMFELNGIAHQAYGTLSGGQRRRVDIARAMIHEPKLLFLDEPSTGLDIQTRDTIWTILNQLREQEGLTILLTTHYLEEAEDADFVYVIDHGKMIAADTVADLRTKFAPPVLEITTSAVETVKQATPIGWQTRVDNDTVTIAVPNPMAALDLLNSVREVVSSFALRAGNLDDIFMVLTGKEIRE